MAEEDVGSDLPARSKLLEVWEPHLPWRGDVVGFLADDLVVYQELEVFLELLGAGECETRPASGLGVADEGSAFLHDAVNVAHVFGDHVAVVVADCGRLWRLCRNER